MVSMKGNEIDYWLCVYIECCYFINIYDFVLWYLVIGNIFVLVLVNQEEEICMYIRYLSNVIRKEIRNNLKMYEIESIY